MSRKIQEKDPCPYRILDNTGVGFAIGAFRGSAYHFLRGSYHSPHGSRFLGGSHAFRLNAPRVAGSIAAWGCPVSIFDCSMVYFREKEDPWNRIFAGTVAGGLLELHRGLHPTVCYAIAGGILFDLIEGAGIVLQCHATMLHSDREPVPRLASFVTRVSADMPSNGFLDVEAGSEFEEFVLYGWKKEAEEKWRQNRDC